MQRNSRYLKSNHTEQVQVVTKSLIIVCDSQIRLEVKIWMCVYISVKKNQQ